MVGMHPVHFERIADALGFAAVPYCALISLRGAIKMNFTGMRFADNRLNFPIPRYHVGKLPRHC